MKSKLSFQTNEITKTVSQISSGNFETLVEKYFKVKTAGYTKEDFRNLIKNYYKGVMNSSNNPAEALTVYSVNMTMAICLRNIIVTRPEMFHQKAPITVRLFEDGDQKFVIGAELSYALWPEKLSEIFENSRKVGPHMYSTMGLEEAKEEGEGKIEVSYIRSQVSYVFFSVHPLPDQKSETQSCSD